MLRFLRLALVALVLVFACTDQALEPALRRQIELSPQFSTATTARSLLPINRIRLRAHIASTNVVIDSATVDVNPLLDGWEVPFEIDLSDPSISIYITIELLNASPAGEFVQWSGQTAPMVVGAADNASVPVTVFPGPLENLAVTALSIRDGPRDFLEGDSALLSVDVLTTGSILPLIDWLSLAPAVATVDSLGRLRTLLPGTARIIARAGPREDTVDVNVRVRPVRVLVTPASADLTSLNAETLLTAVVQDARNAAIAGMPLEWSVESGSAVLSLGGGRFRAIAIGTSTVSVSVPGFPALRVTRQITVTQVPVRAVISPPAASLNARGATAQFSARVEDAGGMAMPAFTATWTSSNPAVATVNNDGLASAVGNGTSTITARFNTPAGVLDATANVVVARTPNSLTIAAGDGQTAPAGSVVPTPPSVIVADANGHPLQGVTVTFGITGGGGSVASGTAVSDVSGRAQSGAWTLGTSPGVNTLSATAAGIANVVFRATATAGPPARISVVAGADQTARAHSQVASAPAIRITDAFGNPLQGVSITFAITAGNGTLTGATVQTDASGIATVGAWTLGGTGVNTITASGAGLTISINATATVGPPATVVAHSGYEQSAPVATVLPFAPAVRVTDGGGNPAPNVSVTFAVIAGSGTLTGETVLTDADGIAHVGSWTLGSIAGTNTMRASVAGAGDVNINATGVAGSPATIAIAAGDAQTAPVGTAVAVDPAVRIRDAYGNVVSGVSVTFAVTGGGGSVTGAAAVTDAAGVATLGSWTMGAAPGPNTLTASAAGLPTMTFTATATAVAGTPSIAIHAGNNQSAQVSTAVATAPAVRLLDAMGAPMAGASVTFTVATGGGAVTGATVVTDAMGIATVGSWSLGAAAGPNTLTAASTGVGSVTFTATATAAATPSIAIHAGNNQSAPVSTAVPTAPAVRILDAMGAPMAGTSVTFTVATGGGAVTGATVVTDAMGIATVGSWSLGAAAGPNTLTAAAAGVGSVTFNATAVAGPPPVGITLTLPSGHVGVSFTAPLHVTINPAAPAGGLVVAITSDDTNKLTVASPGTITFAQGATTGTIVLSGVLAGSVTVRANAPGFPEATLVVPVSLRLISLPGTLNVPYGASASVPITLAEPAPAGGTTVTLTSSNPATVQVSTPTVLVPAGAMSANGTAFGLYPGSATLTATATNYIAATSAALTAANLDIQPTGQTINESFGGTYTIRFQSSGTPVAAPAGGITVTLSSANAACATSPASVVIPAGVTQVATTVAYGGSAVTPCTTKLFAMAPDIAPDSMSVTVQPVPAITIGAVTVASGLQRYRSNGLLGATNHGGVTVRLVSTDSSKVLLTTNPAVVGTGTIDVAVPAGGSNIGYYVQALENVTGTVPVIATAPMFRTDTADVVVVQPGIEIQALPATLATLTGNRAFYAQVGIPCAGATAICELQDVRGGGPPRTVTFTVPPATTVATLATSAGDALTVTAVIIPERYYTPTAIATGGVAFRPLGPGSATVTASSVGVLPTTQSTRTVTITGAVINANNANVGAGLMESAFASLSASNHGGISVRVTSQDSARVRVSPNSNTAGNGHVDVFVPNGSTSVSYYVHGVEGLTGTVPVTFAAAGFTDDTATVTLRQPYIELVSLPTNQTLLGSNQPFYAQVGISTSGVHLTSVQNVRAGAPPLVVTFAHSAPAVGQLQTTALTADTVTAGIVPSFYYTPTSVGTGGVAYDPVGVGVDTVRVSAPGYALDPNAVVVVTVTAPAITMNPTRVGSSLQTSTSINLGATAHGGVTVHLVSSDSSKLKLAPNATTPGTGSLDIVVPNGTSSLTYYVQGMDATSGTSVVTATAPGFTTASTTHTIVPSLIEVANVIGSLTTLSQDDPFYAQVGIPFAGGTYVWDVQNLAAGHAPVTVTFTSSTTAATLTTLSTTGGTVTAQIQPNLYYTPLNVASGGVALRPVTAGSTSIAATAPLFGASSSDPRPVTITAPAITVSSSTVGAGLMLQSSAFLGAPGHGGVNVRIRSSNGAIARVSTNAATVGTDSVDIFVPDNQTFLNFYVHGMEGTSGTVTLIATAAGFTDGTGTATIVPAAFEVIGLATTYNAVGNDDAFYVQTGPSCGACTSLNSVQAVRFGAPALTATVTTSNPAVATLKKTAGSAATQTVQVPAGSSFSPTSVVNGGVALDLLAAGSTTVTATIPGYIAYAGTLNISVSAPAMTLSTSRVGTGLMQNGSGTLTGGNHGGVTVRITSSDSTRMKVAPNSTTLGTGYVDIVVPAGNTTFFFSMQAMDVGTGNVTLTASTAGFTSATSLVEVVQPVAYFSSLSGTYGAAATNDLFFVIVGIPDPGNAVPDATQAVRFGSAGIAVTVTSSNPAAGLLQVTAGTSASVTVTIPAQSSNSPGSVAAGGVAFDPVGVGSTTVSLTAPGFRVINASSVNVIVN